MADKSGIRSLVHLQNSASTARVLNLVSTWHRHKDKPEYTQQPFFQNPRLNRTIILKHRLRRDEFDLFPQPCLSGTKILFPVDLTDLRLGGKSLFVGQKNFAYLLEDAMGKQADALDLRLLELLHKLPSLDPFLMREELRRNGYQPAPCYLELSEADLKRIFTFVQGEIEPLVQVSLNGQASFATQTSKLVSKILANALDSEMAPLRMVLRLNESEFAEGVFCWKGFLYYKWVYERASKDSGEVVTEILKIMPRGAIDMQSRDYIERQRTILAQAIIIASDTIKNTLRIYDKAYVELTKNGNPVAFRDFLLNSPNLFSELGEQLGVLNHITSFWRYRFPATRFAPVGCEELVDIFMDFEGNLQMLESVASQKRAAG